jgi:hypothetical protein
MIKGYLICKSLYDGLEEFLVDNMDAFALNSSNNKEDTKIKCVKCPLTKKPIEKSKIRKVYFC